MVATSLMNASSSPVEFVVLVMFVVGSLLEKWATVYAFSTGSRMNRY
jgi:hypothetical protein